MKCKQKHPTGLCRQCNILRETIELVLTQCNNPQSLFSSIQKCCRNNEITFSIPTVLSSDILLNQILTSLHPEIQPQIEP